MPIITSKVKFFFDFFSVPVQISANLVRGNKTLEEGADLSLYCNVTGFPNPSVTWTKGGADAPIVRNSWLNLTTINRDKAGDYTCNGNNACGKKSSAVITIDVQCKNALLLTLSLNYGITEVHDVRFLKGNLDRRCDFCSSSFSRH